MVTPSEEFAMPQKRVIAWPIFTLPVIAVAIASCTEQRNTPVEGQGRAIGSKETEAREAGTPIELTLDDDGVVSETRMKQLLASVTGWEHCNVIALERGRWNTECQLPADVGEAIHRRLTHGAVASHTSNGYLEGEPQLMIRVDESTFVLSYGQVKWRKQDKYFTWNLDGLWDTSFILYNRRAGDEERNRLILDEMACLFMHQRTSEVAWLTVAKCGARNAEKLRDEDAGFVDGPAIRQLLDSSCNWNACQVHVLGAELDGNREIVRAFSLPREIALRISNRIGKGCIKRDRNIGAKDTLMLRAEPMLVLCAGDAVFMCQGVMLGEFDDSCYVWHIRGLFDAVRAMQSASAVELEHAINQLAVLFD
jgi:hypothetical protein